MTVGFFPRDEYFMRLALREAERALEHDDVPVSYTHLTLPTNREV